MKARLCNNEMGNLVDILRKLPEVIAADGVEGSSNITVASDGGIIGVFAVSTETTLKLEISDDGRKGAWEYIDD